MFPRSMTWETMTGESQPTGRTIAVGPDTTPVGQITSPQPVGDLRNRIHHTHLLTLVPLKADVVPRYI